MKRPMTLVAGIVGVVFDAIYAVIALVGITAILELLGGAKGSITLAIIAFMEIAVVIDALVMNAISITGFACDHEKYRKKYRFFIQAIVMNTVLAALMIYSMVGAFSVLNLFVLLASIASTVLYIVDMCIEKKRVEAASAKTETPAETPVETPAKEETPAETPVEETQTPSSADDK